MLVIIMGAGSTPWLNVISTQKKAQVEVVQNVENLSAMTVHLKKSLEVEPHGIQE